MTKKALLFGSIGTVMETSDIQRRSYNDAMKEAGLPWEWDRRTYSDLLSQAGGKERLSHLASATNTNLSEEQIETIHRRKTEIACSRVASEGVGPRPGIGELIKLAKERGMKLALVTTTYRPNVEAVFVAAGDSFSERDFDVVVTRDDVERGKPAPDAYLLALQTLGIAPAEAIAIEDTANSVMAAKRASLAVVATPGELTGEQDFWQADLVVHNMLVGAELDPQVVRMLD